MEDYNWEALKQLIKDDLARVYIQKEGDVVTTAIDERGREVELEEVTAKGGEHPQLKESMLYCDKCEGRLFLIRSFPWIVEHLRNEKHYTRIYCYECTSSS